MASDLICVGAILGAFGVKGELRLKSFCANPSDIGRYQPLYDETSAQEFTLKITRAIKGGFAVRLKGVQFRDQAEALKGTSLYVKRDALPHLPDDEFYHSDLIGLAVIDTGGVKLGHIKAVFDHGAGDLLEVAGTPLKTSILIPFTKAIVPTVDLKAKRVIVDLPDGILPPLVPFKFAKSFITTSA